MFKIDLFKRTIKNCPECKEFEWIFDKNRGEISCKACGFVRNEKCIDLGEEWRAFSSEEAIRRIRTGAPSTLKICDKGLSTVISWQNIDAYGNYLSPNMVDQVRRLRIWQNRCRKLGGIEKTMAKILPLLSNFISQLKLSNNKIYESVAYYLRKIREKDMIKGNPYEIIVLATIYFSCRQFNIPLSFKDIIETFDVNKRELYQFYIKIRKEFPLKLGALKPLDLIAKYCNMLNISENCQQLACKIVNIAEQKRITQGKSPAGIAAGAIYLAAYLKSEQITQYSLSKVARVTETTLRKHYKNFRTHIDLHEHILPI
ncbi:MAG: transcription initiation factor IIB family protein [Promethearchaeota archaeon]